MPDGTPPAGSGKKLGGHNQVVEADETYVGGKAKNRKNHVPPKEAVVPSWSVTAACVRFMSRRSTGRRLARSCGADRPQVLCHDR